MKVREAVAKYIELRDQKDARKKEHTEEIRQRFLNPMERIENALLKHFNETNSDNLRCKGTGIAFIKTRHTDKITDRKAFLKFVDSTDGGMDFLDVRPSKRAVDEYIEQHDGDMPPGLSRTTDNYVNIRRD